ncbi:MAG: co-chaperone DjlA [Gammaproteobacteria bacterium]
MTLKVQEYISAKGWWGKIIFAALGAIKGPVGMIVGALFGHQIDRGYARIAGGGVGVGQESEIQARFFAATFAVMGAVAKSDGRVSESEIALARTYMQRFDMDEARRKEAIKQFTIGKSSEFPLDATLQRLAKTLRGRERLIYQFVEIQVDAMLADQRAHPKTRELLWRICQKLGVGRVDLAQMESAAHARRGGFVQHGGVDAAYKVLGVESDVANDALKKAYRRLMSRHHPDKLMAKGLPQEMMTQAREKTQAIQAAYETIKSARGLN